MKDTFLKLVAQDIVKTYGANLSHFVVVFPYSAPIFSLSSLLFQETNESLSKPVYTTITELFRKAAGLEIADNLRLVCALYKAYQTAAQEAAASIADKTSVMEFDEFYRWGEMILNDFSDADKELADTAQLFRDVSAAKNISSEDYLTPEQKEILQRFFKTFIHSGNSRLKEKYLSVWNLMPRVYTLFNEANAHDGIAYEGAAFRKGLDAILRTRDSNGAQQYVFVGFNALCKAEKELMTHLRQEGLAIFYWDYDTAYCNGISEAGRFVVENVRLFGNKIDEAHFNNISSHSPIEITESPTKSGSISYGLEWAERVATSAKGSTVLVPASNDILPLLLHFAKRLPENHRLNTRIPVATTATFAHIMRFIDRSIENNTYTDKDVSAFIGSVENEIAEYSVRFTANNKESVTGTLPTAAAETAAARLINETATRVKELVNRGILPAGLKTVCSLLQQEIRNSLVSPSAEADSRTTRGGIDVRTLNDTRILDYDNVLVIGCNEGDLPPAQQIPSLIPDHIRRVYNLPTADSRNTICAYNFYRLLQRAGNVALVFTSEENFRKTGEPSRYIMQIIGENILPYKAIRITSPSTTHRRNDIEILKTPDMFGRMKHLEATSLYRYICCPLMFYFSKVARISTPMPSPAKMPANLFGTLFHAAMQLFYEDKYAEPLITREMLEDSLERNAAALDVFIDNAFVSNKIPTNAIIKKVVKEYMKNTITYDIGNTPFKIRQQFIEKFLYTTIPVATSNCGTMTVNIGGKFDRVDNIKIDGRNITRVVDYKTSRWKKPLEAKDMESVFGQPQKDRHYDYIFQTFLYSLALLKNMNTSDTTSLIEATTVAPAVFFITASKKDGFDPYITYGDVEKEKLLDFSKVENDFREHLQKLLHEMFDVSVPFRAGYKESCTFCEFKQLCDKYPPPTHVNTGAS